MATTKVINDVIDLNQTGNTTALKGCVGTTSNITDGVSQGCSFITAARALYELNSNGNDTCGNYNSTGDNSISYSAGKYGNAANFTSVSYITLPSGMFERENANTLSMWIYLGNVTDSDKILFYSYNSSNATRYYIAQEAAYITFRDSDNSNITNVSSELTANTWTHFAAVSDGSGGYTFYTNGTQSATGSFSNLTDLASLTRLGDGYTGSLDQIRFYSSALTASEISQLYTEGQLTKVEGMLRTNTDLSSAGSTSAMQFYKTTGDPVTSGWVTLANSIYEFTLDFLVIAGGGGGSRYGGGGAGGLRTSFGSTSGGGASNEASLSADTTITYTITIGTGGSGGNRSAGSNGQNSVFSTITSIGGGQGRSGYTPNVIDGGSGGGGETSLTSGNGQAGQGYNGGGVGYGAGAVYNGTGGGGASQAGGSSGSSSGTAGTGGNGLSVSITGSAVTYAGGGGGSDYQTSSGGSGGSGGGGNGTGWQNGATPETPNGTNGTDNLGGGGGGGMNGGSGVVILRCTRPTATLSAGITVNSITGAGTVSGTAISGTSDYYYSATSGSGTITFN